MDTKEAIEHCCEAAERMYKDDPCSAASRLRMCKHSAELIEREALLAKIQRYVDCTFNGICSGEVRIEYGPGGVVAAKTSVAHDIFCVCNSLIEKAPVIDAAPVVHGKWISPDTFNCHCSICGEQPEREQGESVPLYDYCPYCGARMDGGEGHEAD